MELYFAAATFALALLAAAGGGYSLGYSRRQAAKVVPIEGKGA